MGLSVGPISVCSSHDLPILPFGRSEAEATEFIKPADAERLILLEDAYALIQITILIKQLYELQPEISGEETDAASPFSIAKKLLQTKGEELHRLAKEIRRAASTKDLFMEVLGSYSPFYNDLTNALNSNQATNAEEKAATLEQIGTVKTQYSIVMAKLASMYNRLSPATKEFFLERLLAYYTDADLINQPLTQRLTSVTNDTLDDLLPNKLKFEKRDSEYTANPDSFLEGLDRKITEACTGLQQQLATAPYKAKKKDPEQSTSAYAWKLRLGTTAGNSSGSQDAIPNYPVSRGMITPRAGVSFKAGEHLNLTYDYTVPFKTDGDPYFASDDASASYDLNFSGGSMLSLGGRYLYENTDRPNTYTPTHRTGIATASLNYPFGNIFSLTGSLNYSGGNVDFGNGSRTMHEFGAGLHPTFTFEENNLKFTLFGLDARTSFGEQLTHLQILVGLQHRFIEGGFPIAVISSAEGTLITVPFYLKANIKLGSSFVLSPFLQGSYASNKSAESIAKTSGLAGYAGLQIEWRSQ